MEIPEFRPNRLRDLLGQTRYVEIITDDDRGAELSKIIYWEVVEALKQAGINALKAEPDSPEEDLVAAMIVLYTNALVAGYGYAKLPRRL